jgi:hypothetical protein
VDFHVTTPCNEITATSVFPAPHILVARPLQHGIISDYEVAEKMLRYFIDKVHEGGISLLSRPRIIVGVHYLTDVLCGLMFGTIIAGIFMSIL